MRVGIYGGTFNPPHTGHEHSARAAKNQLNLDVLVIVPSGIPPHKLMPLDTPNPEERLKMTIDVFSDLSDTVVSDIEVKNPKPSYATDTVMSIKNIYPEAELFLLMGTDMFLSLEEWKDYRALLKNITPAVFSRDKCDEQKIEEFAHHLKKEYGISTEIITTTVIPVSSSYLRNCLPNREGRGYIKDTNYSYIIRDRLYCAKPDWRWLREKAYSMLTPKRIPHVAACEDIAVELAARWDVSIDDAKEAAILHDITKRFNYDEHIKAFEDSGVSTTGITKAEEKLLHARTGAVLAKALFGVSDTVEDAIRWHTTGKSGMSKLAKVLYLADYIEATRDFPGVEELRKLAFLDLDKAMLMGLEMTASDLRTRGIVPEKTTLEAIADLENNQ